MVNTASAFAIDLREVGKAFGELGALTGINLRIARESRVGIAGPSGGGKTTLLQIVAGLLEPDSRLVLVGGAATARRRLACCALMRQRDLLLPWRTALDNAAIALENGEVPRAEARTRTRPLFERFGLASFENARPAQLSGCMCQRVSFLPTLMAEKDVLLLDEPFGALDSITRAQMQEWLVQARAAIPRTVLLVTHDVEEAFAAEPARVGVLDANRGAARAPPRGKRTSAPGQANLRASEPRTPRGTMSPT